MSPGAFLLSHEHPAPHSDSTLSKKQTPFDAHRFVSFLFSDIHQIVSDDEIRRRFLCAALHAAHGSL
jgi:hypothetical protein